VASREGPRPFEVLYDAALRGWYKTQFGRSPRAKWVGRPGEMIENLPADQRDVLKRLTSDDAQNVSKAMIDVFVEPPTLWERIARRR
jgi:hypothetical protein